MILQKLLVLINILYLTHGQTTREMANDPNEFHMFENFEMTKSLYINETKIVRKLKTLRKRLMERQHSLKTLVKSTKSPYNDLLSQEKNSKQVRAYAFSEMNNLTEDFPNDKGEKVSDAYSISSNALLLLSLLENRSSKEMNIFFFCNRF